MLVKVHILFVSQLHVWSSSRVRKKHTAIPSIVWLSTSNMAVVPICIFTALINIQSIKSNLSVSWMIRLTFILTLYGKMHSQLIWTTKSLPVPASNANKNWRLMIFLCFYDIFLLLLLFTWIFIFSPWNNNVIYKYALFICFLRMTCF